MSEATSTVRQTNSLNYYFDLKGFKGAKSLERILNGIAFTALSTYIKNCGKGRICLFTHWRFKVPPLRQHAVNLGKSV
jgi:hypothetical protein